MKIHSVSAQNFRPFSTLEEVQIGSLTTIIGKNDAGKSSVLKVLDVFFHNEKLDDDDVHYGANEEEDVIIEICFTDLPIIEIEEGVETTFEEEMLVDSHGFLRIIKIYHRDDLTKFEIVLNCNDYEDDDYSGLVTLSETQLNTKGKSLGLDFSRAGRGITNKDKRKEIREKASVEGINLLCKELPIPKSNQAWKAIEKLLPKFDLFDADSNLGINATSFQREFNQIIIATVESGGAIFARDALTTHIENALQREVDQIFERFKNHTDDFERFSVKPKYSWHKAVTFDIVGKDQYAVEKSIDQRGTGVRRILMVAFFQHMAEKVRSDNFIYGIEEPENSLHPGLQRELFESFFKIAKSGNQIIVTSHSPVFAGSSPLEDLVLIKREGGLATANQSIDLDLAEVAKELGVEPSDQITGYDACVFVEGINDVEFFKHAASEFKRAGRINEDFDDKNIGFVICGGDSLKHWIDLKAMRRLNTRFAVVIDSDKDSETFDLDQKKLDWKQSCEDQEGVFHILKKRSIENYIHPDKIRDSRYTFQPYNDYTPMKQLYNKKVYKLFLNMNSREILEMDVYNEDGEEKHEILEIVENFLDLAP
jgi:putative ATP-dependent endonuclease of OLD family